MAFVTEVDLPGQRFLEHTSLPPPDAFRNAGRGHYRRWLQEQAVAATERRDQRVAAVDSLRDAVLGRVSAKAAEDSVLVLPSLPPLRDFRTAQPLPFFHPEAASPQTCCIPVAVMTERTDVQQAGVRESTKAHFVRDSGYAPTPANSVDEVRPTSRDATARPMLTRDTLQTHLQSSTSWTRLPSTNSLASKVTAKAAFQRAASLPSLPRPEKATAPVKKLLPFQKVRGVGPQPEAFAPHLGARAKRAEVQMLQRLRG